MSTKKNLVVRVCARCGTTEKCIGGGIPPGWAIASEGEKIDFICPGCVRANLRAIEGKLPQEYWDQ
jgi:hypothetical protein